MASVISRPGGPWRPGRAPPALHEAAAVPAQQGPGRRGIAALVFALLSGLITLGYHLFEYPLYSTDEGTYMERAWAVIRLGGLAPVTYIYDHAPGGWLFSPAGFTCCRISSRRSATRSTPAEC